MPSVNLLVSKRVVSLWGSNRRDHVLPELRIVYFCSALRFSTKLGTMNGIDYRFSTFWVTLN